MAETFEVKIAIEMLDSVEKMARERLGDRSMPIPPEMALIMISVYREHLIRLSTPSSHGLSAAAAGKSREVELLCLRCHEAENLIQDLTTVIPEDERYIPRMMEIRAHFEKWEGPSEVAIPLDQFPPFRSQPAAASEAPGAEAVNTEELSSEAFVRKLRDEWPDHQADTPSHIKGNYIFDSPIVPG